MEEFVLCPLFPRQKLNVVNEHDIGTAVGLPEDIKIPLPNSLDEFIGKLFRRQEDNLGLRVVNQQLLGNRRHQVGFSKSGPTVNEKRIEAPSFTMSHCGTSCVSKLAIVTNYEARKIELWIDPHLLETPLKGRILLIRCHHLDLATTLT